MIGNLTQWCGVLLYDVARYEKALSSSGDSWQYLCNRNENISVRPEGVICNWRWSTQLHAVKFVPAWGRRLMARAIAKYPIKRSDGPIGHIRAPLVSIIIGHKGKDRLPLLQQTLRSFASQSGVEYECIVVEESYNDSISGSLPKWVKYIHLPTTTQSQEYNRSRVFNTGARQARGKLLIFHDNDMMVPDSYVRGNWEKYCKGFQVINLKRFIFYLTEKHVNELLDSQSIPIRNPEFILQNLTGGGSISICREAYKSIGGFDESFIGWGGEDVEFWDRAQTLNVCNTGYFPILHLWHSPQPEKNIQKNTKGMLRLEEMRKIDVKERIKQLKYRQYNSV